MMAAYYYFSEANLWTKKEQNSSLLSIKPVATNDEIGIRFINAQWQRGWPKLRWIEKIARNIETLETKSRGPTKVIPSGDDCQASSNTLPQSFIWRKQPTSARHCSLFSEMCFNFLYNFPRKLYSSAVLSHVVLGWPTRRPLQDSGFHCMTLPEMALSSSLNAYPIHCQFHLLINTSTSILSVYRLSYALVVGLSLLLPYTSAIENIGEEQHQLVVCVEIVVFSNFG